MAVGLKLVLPEMLSGLVCDSPGAHYISCEIPVRVIAKPRSIIETFRSCDSVTRDPFPTQHPTELSTLVCFEEVVHAFQAPICSPVDVPAT